MTTSEFFEEEADLLSDDDFLMGLRTQEEYIAKAVKEAGLEKEIMIRIDPVFVALDISISAYALAKLLGLKVEENPFE
jgi:hypothetical protein